MKREDVISKVQELIAINNDDMMIQVDKILKSGAINLDDFDNNYFLPKIILSALLLSAHNQYLPLSSEGRAEVRNINKFI